MQARKRGQLLITKNVQNETLAEEIKCLEKQKELPKSSPLIKLSPVLGSKELIRVGGRLDWADLPYEERHSLTHPSRVRMDLQPSARFPRRRRVETHDWNLSSNPGLDVCRTKASSSHPRSVIHTYGRSNSYH